MSRPPSPPADSESPRKEGDPPLDPDPDVPKQSSKPTDKAGPEENEVKPPIPPLFGGDPRRMVTLVPKRRLVNVDMKETPSPITFTDAVLVMIPIIPPPSRLRNEIRVHTGASLYNTIDWELGLYDMSVEPPWKVWRPNLDEGTAAKVTDPGVIDSGFVCGRVTTETARDLLIATIEAQITICVGKASNTHSWVNHVLDQVQRRLPKDINLETVQRRMANDGILLRNLFEHEAPVNLRTTNQHGTQDYQHTLSDILSHQSYAMVDQYFLTLKDRWSSNASPPCTLFVGARNPPAERDIVYDQAIDSVDDGPQRAERDVIPRQGTYTALLLVPDVNSQWKRHKKSSVFWRLVLARIIRGDSEVLSIHLGFKKESDEIRVKLTGATPEMVMEARGGIMIGYCAANRANDTGPLFVRTAPCVDPLDWVEDALRAAIGKGLILSPDRTALLTAAWLDAFVLHMRSALQHKISVLQNDGENSTVDTIENHIAGNRCQLVEEQYLALMREWSREGLKEAWTEDPGVSKVSPAAYDRIATSQRPQSSMDSQAALHWWSAFRDPTKMKR